MGGGKDKARTDASGVKGTRLHVKGVSVRFEGITAIDNFNETIERGEILGLIGPNGAGKTTLINAMTGFQRPSSGEILLDDKPITKFSAHWIRRHGIARTFQAGRLFREMSVSENVEVAAVGLGLGRHKAHAHAMELLDWIGLADKADIPAGALAYTDERRVGIARALAMEPNFVLLDEPAAGMSDLECDDLMQLVDGMRKKFGCGVLLIEHNMRVVMGVCERIHVLDSGRTIARGTPEEVKNNPTVIEAYLGEG